ncbi:MAG: ferritin-like domain-containing protein [Candidatus Eremiobacteraeota bacterium]|nr:ferritin-like domain-containing protein [Candidatus Eremiobacteraeota bacterium]
MSDHFAVQGRPLSLFGQHVPADLTPAEQLEELRTGFQGEAATSNAVMAGLTLAAAPIALAALASNASAQSALPAVGIAVLNFALVLERLESAFYMKGVAASGLIPASDRAIFTTINGHEAEHVAALTALLGRSARPSPTFDFTGGKGSGTGPYADVFTNYATFTAVAQAFEDTGVRAYKGQAPSLKPYPDALTTALTIHSVEARHASEIRRLRGNFDNTAPHKGWITGNQTDVPGASAVYAGEENVIQGGVDVTTLTSAGMNAATEAFDEPLTMAQVLAIAGNFIAA